MSFPQAHRQKDNSNDQISEDSDASRGGAYPGVAGLLWSGDIIPSTSSSLVTEAQAVIGRPLTPLSYAGVARRTVRRCAVGVYYC